MGNRTEYLLATMKTPQYDTAGFANASNQLVNALNMGANQIGEYNKQKSQAYANQYVNDLLGKTNEANYSDNISKLRGMGAYTSPEMQKQIEGIASDIKDQRTYNLQKEQARLAQSKFDYDKAQQLKKEDEELYAKVGALGGAQSDILGSMYQNGKVSHPLLAKGIEGIDTGSVAAAKEGLLNLPEAERASAMQQLNNRINEAYGEYANYNTQRGIAANQETALQSLLAQKESSDKQYALQKHMYDNPHYAPSRDIKTDANGNMFYIENGIARAVKDNKGNQIKEAVKGSDDWTIKTIYNKDNERESVLFNTRTKEMVPISAGNNESAAQAYVNKSLNK